MTAKKETDSKTAITPDVEIKIKTSEEITILTNKITELEKTITQIKKAQSEQTKTGSAPAGSLHRKPELLEVACYLVSGLLQQGRYMGVMGNPKSADNFVRMSFSLAEKLIEYDHKHCQ